jgi:hypothetical protein
MSGSNKTKAEILLEFEQLKEELFTEIGLREKLTREVERLKSNEASFKSQLADQVAAQPKPISVVYPYVEKYAQWEELRYSLRSMAENFKEPFQVFIVGDRPKWLTDEAVHIPSPVVSKNPPLDIAKKLLLVIKDERVTDDFIWMNDDIYLLNPVVLEDIKFLKCAGTLESAKTSGTLHQNNKGRTFGLLRSLKKSTWDYSTHLPFFFNKKLMADLIAKFNLAKQPYLITTLYHNFYFADRIPLTLSLQTDNMKLGVYRRNLNEKLFDQLASKKKFLNHSQSGFAPKVQKFLEQRFKKKTLFEK